MCHESHDVIKWDIIETVGFPSVDDDTNNAGFTRGQLFHRDTTYIWQTKHWNVY